jgi:hypothetical protein
MSTITIQMTALDAEQLTTTSMAWGSDWAEQDGRFESVKVGGPAALYTWQRAYWLEPGTASMILFTSFIAAYGFGYEVLWDLVDNGGYVVLTDWVSE